MHQQIVINHFYNAMLMGEKIFTIYLNQAHSKKLKKKIEMILQFFSEQQAAFESKVKKEHVALHDNFTLPQKNAIMLEKLKTKTIQNDLELCLNMIKALDAATIGGIKYLKKCDHISTDFLKEAKKVIHSYNLLREKIQQHALLKHL